MPNLTRLLAYLFITFLFGCAGGSDPTSLDNDYDGVTDSADRCLSTQSGTMVNPIGCQIITKSQCILNENGTACLADLPYLAWPLPEPSSAKVFLQNEIQGLDLSTVGSLSNNLESILVDRGYERFSYYNIPLGIAMVTQLERIEEDGTPFPHPERWKYGDMSLSIENFSFASFLARFMGVDVGNYRVLIFVIADDNIILNPSGDTPTTSFVESVASDGALILPSKLYSYPFENAMRLSLFVYEVEKKQTNEVEISDLNIHVKEHLTKSGIILNGVK
jgi:hypothetical protein